jgi:hypothetical protein
MPKLHSSFVVGFSESYLADLGRVVVAWSHLEMSFDMLYLSLVVMRGAKSGSMSEPRVPTFMGKGFKHRVEDFRRRLSEIELPDATRVKATKILDGLVTMRNERDEIAHSQFTPKVTADMQLAEDSAIALFKSWRNQKPHTFKEVRQGRLKKLFQRIDTLYWELHSLALDPQLRAQTPRHSSP